MELLLIPKEHTANNVIANITNVLQNGSERIPTDNYVEELIKENNTKLMNYIQSLDKNISTLSENVATIDEIEPLNNRIDELEKQINELKGAGA